MFSIFNLIKLLIEFFELLLNHILRYITYTATLSSFRNAHHTV